MTTRHMLLVSLFLLIFATPQQALAQTNRSPGAAADARKFDGLWQGGGLLMNGILECPPGITISGTVDGGKFTGILTYPGYDGPLTLTIADDGRTVDGTYIGPQDMAQFTGTVDGNVLAGTWDAAWCGGTFRIEKVR